MSATRIKQSLTPEQRARLENLASEISYDRMTVSFLLEGKNPEGLKASAFFSLAVSKKDSEDGNGFTHEDMKLVRCLLSKQVVATVYDDAIRRKIISPSVAVGELRGILESYDEHIERLMGTDSD